MDNQRSQREYSDRSAIGNSRSRPWLRVTVGLILILAIGVTTYSLWPRPTGTRVTDQDIEVRVEPVSTPITGYLGMHACVECHAERVAEFQSTGHARACRLPRPDEMPPAFAPGKGTYTTRQPGMRFEMTQSGGTFLQTAIYQTPVGEQQTTVSIDLVYGAGTADDVYLSWRDDDRMYELPVSWLHKTKQWGVTHFNPYTTGDFSRELTPRCLECHNTWFEHVPGTANQYRRENHILGVSCESCHGPGAEHVGYHKAHPDARDAHAVVNPGHLARERNIEVCTQCHSNAITHRGAAFSYRPGEPLADYYRTLSIGNSEDDHVANQIAYLRQSKCFQNSETLTCTTCHDPHRPQGPDNAGSASCWKCHESADCGEQEHVPSALRDDCIDCHMPKYVKTNVNFQTETDDFVPPTRRFDHRIAIHPAARQEKLLNWYRAQSDTESKNQAASLTESLVSHWWAQADTFLKEHRYLAAIAALREAMRIEPAPATRERLREMVEIQAGYVADWADVMQQTSQNRSEDAIRTLNKILAVKPDDAKAHGKLGTLYATAGKMDLAIEHLQAVEKYDPDEAYGHGMLGWLAYLDGKFDEAVGHYQKAEEVEPYNGKLNHQIGLALTQLDRLPEASQRFQRALEMEPQRVDTCQCLSLALAQQNQFDEAIPFAQRAVKLTGYRDLVALVSLADIQQAAGRTDDAIETVQRALEFAEKSQPAIVPQILARLKSLQSASKRGSN